MESFNFRSLHSPIPLLLVFSVHPQRNKFCALISEISQCYHLKWAWEFHEFLRANRLAEIILPGRPQLSYHCFCIRKQWGWFRKVLIHGHWSSLHSTTSPWCLLVSVHVSKYLNSFTVENLNGKIIPVCKCSRDFVQFAGSEQGLMVQNCGELTPKPYDAARHRSKLALVEK